MFKKQKYIIIAIVIFLLLVFIKFTIQWRQTEQIKQLIYELSSSNKAVKERAIESLEQIGTPTIPVLLSALEDAQGEAKIYIIQLLGSNGSKDVVLKLAPMLKDSNWRIRFFIAQALGDIGNRDAVCPLLEAWRTEEFWQVSQQIAVTVSKIGYKEEIPNIVKIFNDSHDLHKQILSAILLYEMTEASVYQEFITGTMRGEDSGTKNKILFALKFMKSPKTITLLNTWANNFDKKTQDLILKIQNKK